MDKLNVLILPSDQFGVGHYRSIWVGQEIQRNHNDEFDVDIRLNVPVSESDIGKYDIVHFHRRIVGENKPTSYWITKFREGGAVVVSDIDDYWMPFDGHPAKNLVLKNNIHLDIIKCQKEADWVTTTTEIYRQHLLKYNKNVHVIPNAIDKSMPQWKNKTEPSAKVRVGWIGGSSHMRDLNRIKGTFGRLFNDPDLKDKIQVVMCGYDTRGTVTEIHPETGEERTRKIRPEESIWNKFEEIFNDYGRATDDQYVRRTTLPITRYGEHYNYVDVCLAPLDQHTFNECKSELKLIETGMMNKALIASDLYIYKELLEHGKNALLVDPRKDHKLWFKYIKQIILEPELRHELADNLTKLIYPEYSLGNVTNNRCEWYKQIVNERKNNEANENKF